jgi:Tfp pilus assembly protein PilV
MKMKNSRLNRCHGFASIVEVVIASVIFVVAAFGILTSVSAMRPEATISSERIQAVLAARGALEELRRSLSPDVWNSGDLQIGTRNVPCGAFTCTITVSAVGGGLNDFVRQVDLTVTY